MKPGDEGAVVRFPSPTARPPADGPPPGSDPLWRELVGQVLRSERVELGRTLQQVSERAGVSAQYLSEVERGRKDPSSEMLESICGAVGLGLADLLAAASAQILSTRIGSTGAYLGAPTTRPFGVTSMAA
ncbi:DNA-binding XRE family transcriptional regulator [Nakamurella sp. UYEF19]|uniref:helix-turn-helix domain-containing protein n=1 Tax=Nakamurella sp. UYEF19 TaxID=1756392 RepID=UPI00339A4A57